MQFRCTNCEELHDTSQIAFVAEAPVTWGLLSPQEQARSFLGEEQCEIRSAHGQSFYLRACLEVPVQGHNGHFTWVIWCSLSEASYAEVCQHWEDPQRQQYGPYFAWICTKLPEYPETVGLKASVEIREPGLRPLVRLEPGDHPLAQDQNQGMAPQRLQEILETLLHRRDEARRPNL